jgi:integrase
MLSSACKSPKTYENYLHHINKFREYFIIKDFDSLISIGFKKLQTMIEDYTLYCRNQDYSASSMRSKISALDLFFSMSDITLNWKKIKKMLPERKKSLGEKPYTTEQINQILKNTTNLKFRAIVQFMASSGVRVGSFEELKVKDLEDFKNGCKSVKVYADSKDEYYTFIHQEAVTALEEYFAYRRKKGEKITLDSWVISGIDTINHVKTTSIVTSLCHIVNRVLDRKRTENRFDIMVSHGFRKRFATVLKSNNEINLSISEKLLGHSSTVKLDNCYFKPTLEVMFDEYQKAIPDLVIDQTMKLKLELEKKNEQLSSLEVKDKRIEDLENVLSKVVLNLNELKSRS